MSDYQYQRINKWEAGLTNFDPTPTGRINESFDGSAHKIPLNDSDTRVHITHFSCWCEPVWMGFDEKEFNNLYIHRRMQ